ncbi:MAG: DUF6305 family protein [Acidobacteriota bacterium]
MLLVYKEGNADGRFTTIAKAKGIPLIEVEKLLELAPVFLQIYAK